MYRAKNLLEKAPNIISAAVFAVVNFVAGCVFVAAHIDPSPEFAGLMLSGNTALVLVLNLFVVQPNTMTNAAAAAQSDLASKQTEVDIHNFLAASEEPPEAKPKR